MSTSLGRIVINTRERAVSTDINRLQDLLGQDLGEILRGVSGVPDYPPAAAPENRNCVFRGLTGTPGAGMSVDVAEGHAMVVSTAGAPTADDSAYRLLHSRATQNVVIAPADMANDRWDLIEATFADDITESPLRDIYDPVTGTFAPAVVTKVRRAGVTLQVVMGVAGANPFIPAFTGGNWIPIAAVRVPTGVAALVQNDICDMRPLWVPAPLGRCHGIENGFGLSASSLTADAATFSIGAGRALVDGQLVKRTLAHTVTLANHMDPAFAYAAGEWVYVYLFACRDATGSRPRMTVPGVPTREGYVVVSKCSPTGDGRPLAAVTFPATGGALNSQFAGSTSVRGLYLGALKLGVAATDVSPFMRDNDWIRLSQHFENFTPGVAAPTTNVVDLGVANLLPSVCRMVELDIQCNFITNAGTALHLLQVRSHTGGATPCWVYRSFEPACNQVDCQSCGTARIPLGSTQEFDVYLSTTGVDRWFGAVQNFGIHGIFDPTPRVQ